jgi:hypothetical protein
VGWGGAEGGSAREVWGDRQAHTPYRARARRARSAPSRPTPRRAAPPSPRRPAAAAALAPSRAQAALTRICSVFGARLRTDELERARARCLALVQLLDLPTDKLARLHSEFAQLHDLAGGGGVGGKGGAAAAVTPAGYGAVRRSDVARVIAGRRADLAARMWAASHAAELGADYGARGSAAAVPLQMLARVGTTGGGALASVGRAAKGGVLGVASGVSLGAFGMASGVSSGASSVKSGLSSMMLSSPTGFGHGSGGGGGGGAPSK